MTEDCASRRYAQAGFSLIAVAFLIMVAGLFLAAGFKIYGIWGQYRAAAVTDDKIKHVQSALQQYFTENGRYPCPAPLTAEIDSIGYGLEVASDCTIGAIPGTFRSQGREDRWVRTGAVPVRTLNLPDSHGHDGYRQRLVYAVTAEYAVEGARVAGDSGAITLLDGQGNNATSMPGNIVQIVYSMGWDPNGAYGMNGMNMQPCDPAATSGENCDFDLNATFVNTINKSTNESNLFVHRISYVPNKNIISCEEQNAGIVRPRDTAFLIDTSGSMGWDQGGGTDGFNVQCPGSMPGCSRVDVARWAMRRVIPANIHNNALDEDPGKTAMTGFVGYNNTNNVENNMGDINFDDPTAPNYEPPDESALMEDLEAELQGMCPSGSTPLGIHIMALANRLRAQALVDIANGGDPDRPSKITVLSDGLSNNGMDPVAAANQIAQMRNENPPIYIEVDIIDVVGNPSLIPVSQKTGGSYYRTDNPDALLDALYSSAGICESYTPTPPVDQPGCGSKGDWWENN